jgi:hypothetical protein
MFSFLKSRRIRTHALDTYLTEYLAYKYRLTPAEVAHLQYVKADERIASRDVSLFRIYDPARVGSSNGKVTYAVLNSSPEAVLFEGRFAPNGNVSEIKDLRRPA